MEQKLNIQNFSPEGCKIKNKGDDSFVVEVDKNGGGLYTTCSSGKILDGDLNKAKYIAIDITNLTKHAVYFYFHFYENPGMFKKPDLSVGMGLIPGLKTTLALPLQVLDSQKAFLERTPGKLKSMVKGKKININDIKVLSIGCVGCFGSQTVEISNMRLTDQEPEYQLPDSILVDEMGQWMGYNWPGKTQSVLDLEKYLEDELNKLTEDINAGDWSVYGGWKKKKFEATGYFRTQHDGRRWWFVDPDGYAFVSTGIDSVVPGESGRIDGLKKFFKWLPDKNGEYYTAWKTGELFDKSEYFNFAVSNLIRAFGDKWWEGWAKITGRRLKEWGVNTAANWSSVKFAKHQKVSYVWQLEEYPSTGKKIFRDFPDVFSEEFKNNAEKYASQLEAFKDDKYLIGYFMGNEPNWAYESELNIAEELLGNENEFAAKAELIIFLKKKYREDICLFNSEWNLAFKSFDELNKKIERASRLSDSASRDLGEFSKIMIRKYIDIPCEAVKKRDSNHLNLGIRYSWEGDNVNMLEGCSNFDVLTLNCYKMSAVEEINSLGEITGMPILIGEFHFGALDRGLLSTGLRGVSNQEERGKAYRYYVENAISTKYCIGTQYFILNDQAVLGRFDGENFQIGCVDGCHKPYEEFIQALTLTNKNIYDIAEGIKASFSQEAVEIDRNAI